VEGHVGNKVPARGKLGPSNQSGPNIGPCLLPTHPLLVFMEIGPNPKILEGSPKVHVIAPIPESKRISDSPVDKGGEPLRSWKRKAREG